LEFRGSAQSDILLQYISVDGTVLDNRRIATGIDKYYLTLLCAERGLFIGIQADDVQRFIPRLLSSFHVETLIHGNVSEKEASRLVDILKNTLKAEPLNWLDVEISRAKLLPRSTSPMVL
jgi:secreted Zn-dependent insulinase-like peptidase